MDNELCETKKKKRMKWLIFGANGWLGNQVVSNLETNIENVVVSTTVRADNVEDVETIMNEVMPDRVVSLIGRTHGNGFSTIDYLEQKGKLRDNVRDNLYGPFVLAMICFKRNIHLTYMGTGCIFTYEDEKETFHEDDAPNFFGSSYSIVKGYTDQMMKQFNNVLNVRIRMPITADFHPRNFITKIINYEKVCSMPNSMTVIPELLPIMLDMAEKRVIGTINLTNPGCITHNEVLQLYKDIVDPSFTWENFSVEEQNQVLMCERSNNTLDTERLMNLYPNVRPIKTAITACLYEMKGKMSV